MFPFQKHYHIITCYLVSLIPMNLIFYFMLAYSKQHFLYKCITIILLYFPLYFTYPAICSYHHLVESLRVNEPKPPLPPYVFISSTERRLNYFIFTLSINLQQLALVPCLRFQTKVSHSLSFDILHHANYILCLKSSIALQPEY
jgi:hypothetical protein